MKLYNSVQCICIKAVFLLHIYRYISHIFIQDVFRRDTDKCMKIMDFTMKNCYLTELKLVLYLFV